MLNHDDEGPGTRWQRVRARVESLPLDGLLRWALLANVVLVSLFSAVALLTLLGSAVATVAATLVRLVS